VVFVKRFEGFCEVLLHLRTSESPEEKTRESAKNLMRSTLKQGFNLRRTRTHGLSIISDFDMTEDLAVSQTLNKT
jgi:hypothetical protein